MTTQDSKAIELVIFKPRPGKTEEEVATALASLTPILQSYQGFVDRKLAKSKQNQWMDLVYWASMEEAKFAAEDVLKNEKARKAFEVIDDEHLQFFHFEPIRQNSTI